MMRRSCSRLQLTYRDVRDSLIERGITIDTTLVYDGLQKVGPEVRKRTDDMHRSWRDHLAARPN